MIYDFPVNTVFAAMVSAILHKVRVSLNEDYFLRRTVDIACNLCYLLLLTTVLTNSELLQAASWRMSTQNASFLVYIFSVIRQCRKI